MNREVNQEKFESLMAEVKRPGVDQLMKYIRSSDFYIAPASTRFHLSVEGGLLQHSLNVYDCLLEKLCHSPLWKYLEIPIETIITVSLLHDICKTNFYEVEMRNKKDDKGKWIQVPFYTVNDKVPYGHGEKSAMMIEEFIKLTPVERYAIRWHMGYTEPSELWQTLGQAIEKYPLILALHEADQEASHLLEGETDNKQQPAKESKCAFEEAKTNEEQEG